jgi:Family of unknown function (DUF5360)
VASDDERRWRLLRGLFWATDVGFVAYWALTALHLIPQQYLFKNYDDPTMVNWNWSFVFLDLLISGTGFLSLFLQRRRARAWRSAALVSLTLTSCSGLQAVSFWLLSRDFDWTWWLPNLYLLLYPIPFIVALAREGVEAR